MTAAEIIREVAAAHGTTPGQIKGRRFRSPMIVAARIAVISELVERGQSFASIGRQLGDRRRTTIEYYAKAELRARKIAETRARQGLAPKGRL